MQLQKSTIITAGSYLLGYVEPSRWCQDAGTDRFEALRVRQDRTTVSLGRFTCVKDAAAAIMAADLGRDGPRALEFVDDV